MRGNSGLRRAAAPPHFAWALAIACLMAAACKPVPSNRYEFDSDTKRRGVVAIKRVGCGACHEISGVDWPKGRTAPSLVDFDDVGVIAGSLPNTPANLAAFVRNAPKTKPGSTMPAMPLTEQEARDVAAYLLGADDA